MRSYRSTTPRALFGALAVALTALTIGLFAVLPAETGPSKRVQDIAAAPATQRASDAAIRYIEPVEVVAVRAPRMTSADDRAVRTKRGG